MRRSPISAGRKSMRSAILFIAAYALFTGAIAQSCLVVAVTDGDTMKVRCGEGEQTTIRLAGIDAPEKKQPFGQQSKQSLSGLCYQVDAIVTPKTTDRYGRTVADVQCRGNDASSEQIKAGMAWVYDKYSKGYEGLYSTQDAARTGRVGLWSDTAPQKPWEWRHR